VDRRVDAGFVVETARVIARAACWAMMVWLGSFTACSSQAVPAADGATPGLPTIATVSPQPSSAESMPSASAPEPVASAPEEEPPSGPFTSDRVREIVRKHYDEVGACYQAGLERDPKMKGTIEVHLAIGEDGVVLAANASKDPKDAKGSKAPPRAGRPKAKKEELRIADSEVVSCVEKVFIALRFPPTGRGLVNMIYPVVLAVE
jgi:hypothetical protein